MNKRSPRQFLRQLLPFYQRHRARLIILAILAVAAIFRIWQLWQLPGGLSESERALRTSSQLLTTDPSQWWNTYPLTSALLAIISAPTVKWLANAPAWLRLWPAIAGVLAVGLTYLWLKDWFTRPVAWLGALLMATSSWAVTLSRSVEAAALLPVLGALLIWSLTKLVRQPHWYWPLVAGATLGLGFYVHPLWQAVLVAGLGLAALAGVAWHKFSRPLVVRGLITLLVAVVVVLPIGWQIQTTNQDLGQQRLVSAIERSQLTVTDWPGTARWLGSYALMFNWQGDADYERNLADEPLLNVTVGILVLLGLLAAGRYWRNPRYGSLLWLSLSLWLAATLFGTRPADSLAAVPLLSLLFPLAAIGCLELIKHWRRVFPLNPVARNLLPLVIGLLLLVTVVYDWQRYFVAWANTPEVRQIHSVADSPPR
ncbi:glycosyltransferase family 39 protein [Candidatus Microgenomates bacterium]|nr:glycosyltransferase family 39 protein [Candidatus Microgenomates bacterium]